MAMLMQMRRMKSSAVPHGFRYSFRAWEVAEASPAHVVGDKVEAAGRRADSLESRRKRMNDWSTYCASGGKVPVTNV
jgi:hypothetical protein